VVLGGVASEVLSLGMHIYWRCGHLISRSCCVSSHECWAV